MGEQSSQCFLQFNRLKLSPVFPRDVSRIYSFREELLNLKRQHNPPLTRPLSVTMLLIRLWRFAHVNEDLR